MIKVAVIEDRREIREGLKIRSTALTLSLAGSCSWEALADWR